MGRSSTFPTADSPRNMLAIGLGIDGSNKPSRTSLNWANLPPAPGRAAGALVAMERGKSSKEWMFE